MGFPKFLGHLKIDARSKALILSDLPGMTLKDILLETDPCKQLTLEDLSEVFIKIIKLLKKIHS